MPSTGTKPGKAVTAVRGRRLRFGASTRCALGMHLLRATWVELHAKNRQWRLTEPELT
jgi:hypothetical protein